MGGKADDDVPRFEDLHDPTKKVEDVFQLAIEEPFGRHIRAIERLYSQGPLAAGLVRVHLDPVRSQPAGQAWLLITPLFPGTEMQDPQPVEASIVYGVGGLPVSTRGRAPTFGQSELHNALSVRLAIAHEIGHLALGHVYENGRLATPEMDFTP